MQRNSNYINIDYSSKSPPIDIPEKRSFSYMYCYGMRESNDIGICDTEIFHQRKHRY